MARHHPESDELGSPGTLAPVVPLRGRCRSSIASWSDQHGQPQGLLGGDVDEEAVDRLEERLAGSARFIIIDAVGVTRCGPALLALLGRTQHRLETCQGMLTVVGPRPHLLPPTDLDGSDAAPGSARAVDAPRCVLDGDAGRD